MTVKKSGGNVFADIGFDKEEAANLAIRSELMIEIERIIKKRKLTQSAAARLLEVSQPRISDLKNGKIERFTIDMLVKMLGKLNRKVDFKIKPSKVA